MEGSNAVAIKRNAPKTCWRAYGRDCRQLAMGLVECYESREIEVSDAITVGEHECVVVREPLLHAL
jgi:hypothetical protein